MPIPTDVFPHIRTVSPPRRLLVVVLLAQFVTPLSIAGIAIGLPQISSELGTNHVLLQWSINGFNLLFALFTVIWGPIGDRIGPGRVFLIGTALSTAAATVSISSTSLLMLDLARAAAGIGAAAIITSATAILAQNYTGHSKGRAFALFGTINGLGLALGPSISGLLITLTSNWRAIFAAHAVILFISLALALALPTLRPGRAGLETAGSVESQISELESETDSAEEATSNRPLTHPGYIAMIIVTVAGAAGFVTLLTYAPSALQAVHGDDVATVGLIMLAMTIPVLIGPTVAHFISSKWSSRHKGDQSGQAELWLVIAALLCLVIGPLGLLTLQADSSLIPTIIALFIAGWGFGLPLGIVDRVALSYIPAHRQGTAAGVLNLFRIGSEAVFVAAYAAVLASLVRAQVTNPATADAISAGHPGNPDIYVSALQPVLVGLSFVCLGLLAGFQFFTRKAHNLRNPAN